MSLWKGIWNDLIILNHSGNIELKSYYTNTNIQSIADIIISPDSKHAYCALTGADGIAWFALNQTTGELTYEGRIVSSVLYDNSTALCISPDGNHVYITSKGTNAVSWFSRDHYTGTLTYVNQNVDAVNTPSPDGIDISPDGQHVYIGTSSPNTIVAYYTRNIVTGALTYVRKYSNSIYKGGQCCKISQDGLFVYFAFSATDSIAWFSRNVTTGELTYVSRYIDAVVNDTCRHFSFSPDELFCYAVAPTPNNINILSRDIATGTLTLVETINDSGILVDYPSNIYAANNYVYVASREAKKLLIYNRNITSGKLSLKSYWDSSILDEIRCVVINVEKNILLASSITNNTIISFNRLLYK
jgi:6-phosphogluconolactonase (cycloisomerase 2 family)